MGVFKASDELKRAIFKTNDDSRDANNCKPSLDKSFELFYCSATNSPTGSDGFIVAFRYSSGFMKQIFIDDNGSYHNIYMRASDNIDGSSWQAWTKISNIADGGESYEVKEWYGGGFTADGSIVRFTVPFRKDLSLVKSITISSLGSLTLFKHNGGSVSISKDKISVGWLRADYITFNITSSGFTANTPVGIKLDNLVMIFNT